MRLRANPNRMELLRLRRRLVLAERGHKLLKDKLDELMRSFLETIRELDSIRTEVSQKVERILKVSALLRARHLPEEMEVFLTAFHVSFSCEKERIMNLTVPVFKIESATLEEADPWRSEAEWEVGNKSIKEALPLLFTMARLWHRAELLSDEIEITRRRVNALEHILIPSLKDTIRYIASRLDEIERSYKTQLMRIKDIIEHH
ncbi:MAG: V-type ATP synthase subunit D [Candidatus Aminicenantales bacterium]